MTEISYLSFFLWPYIVLHNTCFVLLQFLNFSLSPSFIHSFTHLSIYLYVSKYFNYYASAQPPFPCVRNDRFGVGGISGLLQQEYSITPQRPFLWNRVRRKRRSNPSPSVAFVPPTGAQFFLVHRFRWQQSRE